MSEVITIKNNDDTKSDKSRKRKERIKHSIYDWISLLSTLFVPLVVGILTIVLPLQQQNLSERQNENSKTIALNTRLQDHELARDHQQQSILNTYAEDLCDLILQYSTIHKFNGIHGGNLDDTHDVDESDIFDDERISLIIRTKTLFSLRQLDPVRKTFLIQLLIDSGVLNHIDMSQADLSSAVFPPGSLYNWLKLVNITGHNISLKHSSLQQSNFSYSILDGSSFQGSNCSYTDLSYAALQRTDWTNADVTQVIFKFSNLSEATLTSQQLATVSSLIGATLPNGSIVSV